ncbi:MAG: hypothetical protein HY423_11815 [Candidatus Lambdaproteobacteria bacterium]|nr:hypothetical protein [Candidatus Lambdaproteobacteria bacterium]
MPTYRLRCEIEFGEIVLHALLWMALILVTLGVGAFFYPYFLQKKLLNHTVLMEREREGIHPK